MQTRTPLYDQETTKSEDISKQVNSEDEIERIQDEMRRTIEADKRKSMKLEGDVDDDDDEESGEDWENDTANKSNETSDNSQYSSVELEAKAKGWKSKEQFTGEPERFISAAEYIKNEGLYGEISGLRKKLKNQDKAMKTMHDLMFKAEERSLKERVDYYEPQVKIAKESGNIDEYETWKRRHEESKQDLENLKKSKVENFEERDETSKKPDEYSKEAIDFVERNTWFKSKNPEDRAMKQWAISEEVRIMNEEPGISYADLYNKIEHSVKQSFAHRFENKNRAKPQAVAIKSSSGVLNSQSKKTQYTFKDDCPKEYRQAVRECAVKFGMGLDEYTSDLYKHNIFKK